MTQAFLILAALVTCQDPKNPTKPGDDDEVVAGLPDGDASPLPDRVQWDWTRTLTAKTATRERFDLSGFWRFAAVDEPDAAVKRNEMGWIEMPAFPSGDTTPVFDRRFRDSDGLWRGKPLDKFPIFWIERDIRITNDDALEWLRRRIFLVLEGPWADGEIYASQRFAKRPAEQDNDAASDVQVHVEPVTGIDRAGGRWCDITEQLVYPGITQISIRFKRAVPTPDGADEASPARSYIGLERWPTGPRIDSIQLRRCASLPAIEATFLLERPRAYMILGMPPVRTLPLSLQVRLEAHDSNTVIAKHTEEIAPLADLKRSVTLTIPYSTPGKEPRPERLRLHAQLSMVKGVFDEPFPIEFRLDDLGVADRDE